MPLLVSNVDKLPTQLKWAQFVRVLEQLDYKLSKRAAGAGRTFVSKTRVPGEVSFHEPHGGKPIPNGTLSEYLRKLKLDRDAFFRLLDGVSEVPAIEAVGEEDRFRRSFESSGEIVSNCTKCFEVVARSMIEAEILAAESAHPCFLPELS